MAVAVVWPAARASPETAARTESPLANRESGLRDALDFGDVEDDVVAGLLLGLFATLGAALGLLLALFDKLELALTLGD